MLALEINDLQKTYKGKQGPVQALKGVSFEIKEGEFFGLLGPNGAGKSTLINILSGVTSKTGGSASVLGTSIDKDHTAVKRMLGVVAQEVAFDAFLPVEDALRYQFGYFGLPVDEAHLDKILKDLSLDDKRKVKPRGLSGGMKRRFMIAKALVHKPKVLVLDEPTAGVDVELRHDLYDVVRELNRQGTTIVLTSHYLEEVELLCERVAIINKGQLVALDKKKDLKDRFQSTRTFAIALAKPVSDIPESFMKFKPTMNGQQLDLTFEESEYQEVLQAVAGAKLPVANFSVIEPTLEDVFVSLTHEE
jgi:ABC-2 type transport system ATP-binding protein